MTIDDIEGGYERTGENKPTGKMDDAKVFVKELMNSRPIKVITILAAGVAIIYISGKIFSIVGDTGKAFLKMRDSFKHTAPSLPLIK
jgi:hypothetical protein